MVDFSSAFSAVQWDMDYSARCAQMIDVFNRQKLFTNSNRISAEIVENNSYWFRWQNVFFKTHTHTHTIGNCVRTSPYWAIVCINVLIHLWTFDYVRWSAFCIVVRITIENLSRSIYILLFFFLWNLLRLFVVVVVAASIRCGYANVFSFFYHFKRLSYRILWLKA